MIRRDVLIGGAAVLSVTVYVVVSAIIHAVGFPLDDSWIHQVYARNLAQQGEWAFVPGEPSTASTSPLYTLLLSIGYLLHIPFFVWTFGLGAAALAGAGWIGARLGEKLFPGVSQVGLWTGLAMVLAWHLVWAASAGMETMLFCMLSLAVVWLAWRDITYRDLSSRRLFGQGMILGLVGAALTLTRPEGAGLVGLSGVYIFVTWPFERSKNEWIIYLGGMVTGWLIGVAPYLLLNYSVSETLLPNTASAKQAENAPALELSLFRRYGEMLLPLIAGGQILLLPGVVSAVYHLFRRLQRQQMLFLLPLTWVFVLISAYALRLPAPYQHGRYVIPALPHILLYGVGGTLTMMQASRHHLTTRVISRSLGLSTAAVMLAFWGMGAQIYGRDVRIINTEMVDTAKWVKQNLPPDELLAVHDIGAVGYYAPRPILDLAGLVSPEVVPIILDHEALMSLMCQRHAQYLMVLPNQRPAKLDDERLEILFTTDAPYSPAAGGGNMMIYRLNWLEQCD